MEIFEEGNRNWFEKKLKGGNLTVPSDLTDWRGAAVSKKLHMLNGHFQNCRIWICSYIFWATVFQHNEIAGLDGNHLVLLGTQVIKSFEAKIVIDIPEMKFLNNTLHDDTLTFPAAAQQTAVPGFQQDLCIFESEIQEESKSIIISVQNRRIWLWFK